MRNLGRRVGEKHGAEGVQHTRLEGHDAMIENERRICVRGGRDGRDALRVPLPVTFDGKPNLDVMRPNMSICGRI
jgi:hypothetical protein